MNTKMISIAAVVMAGLVVASLAAAADAPVISSISPSTAVLQQDNTVITVMGSGFLPGATIYFNGTPLTSTYVAANQMLATVPASNMVVASTNLITATNPGTVASNSMAFTVSVVPGLPDTGFGPASPTLAQNLEGLLVVVMVSFAALTAVGAFKASSYNH